jgi:hypothetical protein
MRKSEIIRGHLADILDSVTNNEQVKPSVIVIIEEPSRKAVDRLANTGFLAHFGKLGMG